MPVVSAKTIAASDVPVDQRQPSDSELSVVFRGDGEPKTPAGLVRRLAEIESKEGLEVDSYSLGGTVEKLERTIAEMLGKEAAAFMPTGTLANHLAIRNLCGTKPRAVVQEQSHLYNDTGDCVTQLSGINLVPLAKDRVYFDLGELQKAVEGSEAGRVRNRIGAVMIESPVRRQAGQIMPYEDMVAVTSFCAERGIATHLDGARLYRMSAATGISPQTYSRCSTQSTFPCTNTSGRRMAVFSLEHPDSSKGYTTTAGCLAGAWPQPTCRRRWLYRGPSDSKSASPRP